ncbi:YtxH domain-containing protein [Patescibacteria group bacterium]|nr:YtxH domain-containing protein [Patescibacteria group bacterium]MBU1683661.1 YtxH domain-containing protein [Patescibacteria group bacterium]
MKIGRYVIGLVSGLTFGMLFAPKQGKKLRDDIIKKASTSGADGLKELGTAFLEAGEEAWSEIKNLSEHEQVEAFLDMSKEKLQDYLSGIEERGSDVAEVAQGKLEEIAAFATTKAKQFQTKAKTKKTAVKKAVTKSAKKARSTVKKTASKVAFASKKIRKVTKKTAPKTKKKTAKKR